jgi:hypothetical protein
MMMRQMVTYITAPLTYKAFASANSAFGEASENSDLGNLIEMSMTSIETKIKMLKQRVEER